MCRKSRFSNPQKKREFVVRLVHHFNGKFTYVQHLKDVLSEYGNEIPENMNTMGYFEGQSHKKHWIATQDYMTEFYERFAPGNEIFCGVWASLSNQMIPCHNS